MNTFVWLAKTDCWIGEPFSFMEREKIDFDADIRQYHIALVDEMCCFDCLHGELDMDGRWVGGMVLFHLGRCFSGRSHKN